MSGNTTAADDIEELAEINPDRYEGEMKTAGTVEEMLENFRRYKTSEEDAAEDPRAEAGASGRQMAGADD